MDKQDNKTIMPKPEEANQLANMLQTILTPIIHTMGSMMEQLNETMTRVATAQQLQSERMAELEKQIRLNTPVTPAQVRHLNEAIKNRAKEILENRKIEDAAALRRLGNAIRKSVLARYGIAAMHEIPRHEYSVALSHISVWFGTSQIMEICKEARMRHEDSKLP